MYRASQHSSIIKHTYRHKILAGSLVTVMKNSHINAMVTHTCLVTSHMWLSL